ncbi:MAG: hypothetical protein FD176_157 [Rhodospirillaceae bacterium]|nr:MAG: hypothetical protein FD176_157 [Rhodospirillaceae bacterium]TNC98675.1 MAG: hypothetical protein FD119_146 [Stygiobacter sp.]
MAALTSEEVEWCAENIQVVRLMMEGDWRAVPVRPVPQMIAAMATHRGKELMQWYAALAQVQEPVSNAGRQRSKSL